MAHEKELLDVLLWEPVHRGSAAVRFADGPSLTAECAALGRTSQTHGLVLSAGPAAFDPPGVVVSRLTVDGPRPDLTDGRGDAVPLADDDPFDAWVDAAVRLLGLWV